MNTSDAAPAGLWELEPLLDVNELAAYLHVPVSTVYDWRTHGHGPRAYRFGKHLKFAVSDVRIWMEQMREPAHSSSPAQGRRTDKSSTPDDRHLR
ncbi:helix-turn-helix domain-containing protein [Rathayibacter sp. YIM 133350]|uniref:helix-turn-helix domain-containing protein n=1 Tax=Rathayibacter sp. YIM 133350 TaxID=3131992 RepID=UPI00307EC236